MNRDQRLAEVLVEFARTLGTDFSIQSILEQLVHRVVEVLPVTGAGVMVMDDRDKDLSFIAASNETIHELEALQSVSEAGPSLTAYQTGRLVAIPDLAVDGQFPAFSPRALEAGLAAVFTFPMRLDAYRVGVLDLYRESPGDLSEGDRGAAQVLADVAAAYLFNARARAAAVDSLALLRHRNLHDPLTGLPNRTMFDELLDRAVEGPRRSHRDVAVVYVDLDHFKSVNDRFGHHFGDLVLMAVAARLDGLLRHGYTLARLAGDEFVVLCEDTAGTSQAEILAEKILHTLTESFQIEGRRVQLTASVGVAFSGPDEEIPELLLGAADYAMNLAKAAGGGHHRVVHHEARLAVDGRSNLDQELRTALAQNEFRLAYQPLARVEDGALVGVEALLRWEHPERGPVPPDVMIPVAERIGLINPLGEWVLRQACADFMRWRQTYGPVLSQVAVNVSALQVMAHGYVATVAKTLDETGIDPGCLHLEVTESVFLDDASRARAVLTEIEALGVQLSLDDFGTGYSSLTYLKRFPFDVVKIGGGFIADLTGDDPVTRAIVAAVIDLARALDLTVVAEGVETQHQLDEIVDLGVDLAQGYLLARPCFSEDLEHQILALAATTSTIRLPTSVDGQVRA